MQTPSVLDAFFRPRNIAVIGASGDLGKMASRPLAYLKKHGFQGGIYPVNPKYQELGDYPCAADIESLPKEIDLAMISLPAAAIPDTVRRCAAKGIKVATILSGGFGELGTEAGRQIEDELRAVIQETGIRVCGPNCQGGINLFDRVAATYSGALSSSALQAGPIALITQSGVFGGLVFAAAQEESIGVGFWASTGNEIDLTFSDFLDYIVEEDRIRVVGGYLESVKDEGALFIDALRRARSAGKPVVLLKTGRTDAGRAAAASHTAALAGSDEGYSAAFVKGGAVRVDSADAFRDLTAAFSTGRIPRGRRVAILSISGGAATLMADDCSQQGLEIAAFSDALRTRLAKVVPVFGSVVNPVDLTGQLVADATLLEKTAGEIIHSGEADIVSIFIGMCDGNKDALVDVIGRLALQTDLPIVVTWVAAEDKSIYPTIRKLGVPVFKDPTACISTVARMVEWALQSDCSRTSQEPGQQVSWQRLEQVLNSYPAGVLSEVTVKSLLKEAGLPIPAGRLVQQVADAQQAVSSVGGEAVMKLQASSIPHKSDIGGVRIGVTPETAEKEFLSLKALFPPDAEGVLVEERIRNARECFVGIQRHPVFGPMVAVGLGGIFIEIFRDVAIRLAPVNLDEAHSMIAALKGFPILQGARGRAGSDIKALAKLVQQVSEIAAAGQETIQEMDLNPIFVRPEGLGVVIGDALLVRA
ncbi:acetate--CoA ligase family protein [Allopusillimonas ginsengisoli]|uniref:acetate--CoA ligase family protein n=1 Tax=Allopusillimonas ginsengisoli TaxID=453575 RepID=UPI001021F385|nr:acetate--CoA ligase family protein [Allopusillimonas ginsengisoli]TEA77779.1 CoA-binding protein [Allopusillimonas ginsengisoli]